jgi:UDP-N-acetylmuramoyl-L-alanyl-D-glutamate--2,6-diaminopimelate ligase
MVTAILKASGKRTGLVSTAFFSFGENIEENPSHLTSISPIKLQRMLRRMVQSGCTHTVIEASSHGLRQHRLAWIWPGVAAITNLTPEHLDYHQSMEQYCVDKGIVFRMLRGKGTKVLNADDKTYASYDTIPSAATITYSVHSPTHTLWLTNPHGDATHVEATLNAKDGTTAPLRLPMPGLYNLENALCAIGCSMACGIPIESALVALRSFTGVPGRLERIDEGQPFAVFVDFAVSQNAYERVLTTLRGIVGEERRILVLCSACGNRMREKRPEIGRTCSAHANIVVVTHDETYGEDPAAVLEEVWTGVDKTSCTAEKIPSRRAAIRFLLSEAKSGDAVVLCGMGPFSTMTTLEGRIPWDERSIAREELRALGYGNRT